MKTNTIVVNIRKDDYDIYIGRPGGSYEHYGNPFTHIIGETLAKIHLANREECVAAFREWLEGTNYKDLEPKRRIWILNNLYPLKDKKLGCFCKPLSCHGDILIEFLEKEREKNKKK